LTPILSKYTERRDGFDRIGTLHSNIQGTLQFWLYLLYVN